MNSKKTWKNKDSSDKKCLHVKIELKGQSETQSTAEKIDCKKAGPFQIWRNQ